MVPSAKWQMFYEFSYFMTKKKNAKYKKKVKYFPVLPWLTCDNYILGQKKKTTNKPSPKMNSP